MERNPIISEKTATIKLVQAPPDIKNLFPAYRYEFQSREVSEESEHMYKELLDFIDTNKELALDGAGTEYNAGFQKALALIRLWIDSIYIKPEGEGK